MPDTTSGLEAVRTHTGQPEPAKPRSTARMALSEMREWID